MTKYSEFITKVQKSSDLKTVHINAAEVSRVVRTFFHVLKDYKHADAMEVMAEGFKHARSSFRKKATKKTTKKKTTKKKVTKKKTAKKKATKKSK